MSVPLWLRKKSLIMKAHSPDATIQRKQKLGEGFLVFTAQGGCAFGFIVLCK